MSDRHSPAGMNLADALRALPLLAPERSAWPQLAAALAREALPARRRSRWPIALAAAIALAFVAAIAFRHAIPHRPATVAPASASFVDNAANDTNANNADTAAKLTALQDRSQALERWLHETDRAGVPLSGQDLAAAAEIEDMIGLVDVQLDGTPAANELLLWHRRVALLEDLTALRYSSYSLAERGVAAN
ncbi:MAG TPA: hypothetical protein VF132_07875 [Rudaea sp.]